MRVAILSDIHGNVLALEAVLADLAAQGEADAVIIAGDLCLDGPRPREVLDLLRSLGYPVVQGNTDRDLVRPTRESADDWHGEHFLWVREQIGPAGLEYLDSLPFSHRVADPTGETALLVVHANPRDLDTHLRPLAPEETIRPLLADLSPEITALAFGHLHIPYTRRVGGVLLADIASVGLPKDGDRRAGYGLFTWQGDGWAVEQRRVEYPVDEVVAQLRAIDAPGTQELIRQLLRARYPNMHEARGGRPPARRAAPASPPTPASSVAAARSHAARAPRPSPAPEPEPASVPSLLAEWVEPESPAAAVVPEVQAAKPVAGPPTGAAESVGAEAVVPPGMSAAKQAAEPDDAVVAASPLEVRAKRGTGGKKTKRASKGEPQVAFNEADSFPAILPRLLGERIDAVLAPMATVREDEDPEGVHDMRVAIRRLRAGLEPAEPFYNPKGLKRATRRVKTLARALGRVRDADVHLISLRKRLAQAAPEERAGIIGLLDTIVAERTVARADLDPVLELWEGHHAPHVAELRAFLARTRPRKGKDRNRDSVAAVALQALTSRLQGLEATAAVLSGSDTGDAEALHQVRIAAKQLRYVLEIFGPVLGPDVGDLLAELKGIQDLLGELHDRDVMIDLLHTERTGAAERELDALTRIALEDGPRGERLASVRAQLAAADGFAATAIGSYGLLIDFIDERGGLERASRERWAALVAAGFLDRLWALGTRLQQTIADLAAVPDLVVGQDLAAEAGAA